MATSNNMPTDNTKPVTCLSMPKIINSIILEINGDVCDDTLIQYAMNVEGQLHHECLEANLEMANLNNSDSNDPNANIRKGDNNFFQNTHVSNEANIDVTENENELQVEKNYEDIPTPDDIDDPDWMETKKSEFTATNGNDSDSEDTKIEDDVVSTTENSENGYAINTGAENITRRTRKKRRHVNTEEWDINQQKIKHSKEVEYKGLIKENGK